MKLSIIIPVYNEEETVAPLLKKVYKLIIPGMEKEIIVIDDGSNDASAAVISKLKFPETNYKYIRHKKNMGKGAAVKTAVGEASGDYIIIQDADLEYDPQDILKIVKPVLDKKAEVVYGTRLKRLPNFFDEERNLPFIVQYIGNKFLSLSTSILYFSWITDMECCYKLFPRKALKNISLHARGFEFEPEITAKLLKMGYKIKEIPIKTNPRGLEEGKKLNAFTDGPRALWALIKYRFVD